jgi:uncharacterized protein YhfF
MRSEATDAFWRAFTEATGTAGDYDVVHFGDSAEMADELADLVLTGTKRATAGLARDFGAGKEPPPVLGGHVVLVDGTGRPHAIWRTTDVRTGPFNSVDAQFAWDEGEGDRTLAWWLDAHRAYFERQAALHGFVFTDDIATIFERFTVVWPPEAADPRA